MKIVQRIDEAPADRPIALTAGSFDGVHLGHQALITDAVQQAGKVCGEAWLLTFNPHPAHLLAPSRAPKLMTTDPQRHAAFESLGLDGCIELPFGQKTAETEAEDFLHSLSKDLPGLTSLSVGPNWTFGYHALGNVDLLKALAPSLGFEARILEPVLYDDIIISSTRIREGIGRGDFGSVTAMLGRPYALSGIVIRGKQEGRNLGFPTANVQFLQECAPADGIFACTVRHAGTAYPGAGYYHHPQGPQSPVFEVHLIGADLDLYGQNLEIQVRHKVRDHQAFSSKTALIQQIQADVEAIQAWLDASPLKR